MAGFPPGARLHTSRDFKRVFRLGFRHRDTYFTLVATQNGLDEPRLGTAIGRKVAGNAVKRNCIKRIIRETFRLAASELEALDIVVTAAPTATHTDRHALRASLVHHWQRLVK